MIQKVYQVTCDHCGALLDYYLGSKKPDMYELINDGFYATKEKQFCDSVCYNNYKNKLLIEKNIKTH